MIIQSLHPYDVYRGLCSVVTEAAATLCSALSTEGGRDRNKQPGVLEQMNI